MGKCVAGLQLVVKVMMCLSLLSLSRLIVSYPNEFQIAVAFLYLI